MQVERKNTYQQASWSGVSPTLSLRLTSQWCSSISILTTWRWPFLYENKIFVKVFSAKLEGESSFGTEQAVKLLLRKSYFPPLGKSFPLYSMQSFLSNTNMLLQYHSRNSYYTHYTITCVLTHSLDPWKLWELPTMFTFGFNLITSYM